MLALIFRGVFLLGAVGWYSQSLWRMIDGYFKDQFKRYLEEEYQRNPKMREDVLYSAVDKPASPLTDPEPSRAEQLERLLDEARLAGKAESGATVEEAERRWEDESAVPADSSEAGAAEKEVARPAETFREAAARQVADAEPPDKEEEMTPAYHPAQEQALPLAKPAERDSNQSQPDHNLPESPEEQRSREPEPRNRQQERPQPRRRRRPSGRPRIGAKSEEAARRRQRYRDQVATLTFTDEDFESASRKRWHATDEEADRDFDEFEDYGYSRVPEDEAGVLVADLPFKPAINIYDLERLSEQEFCPLSLDEDDSSCEETRAWP